MTRKLAYIAAIIFSVVMLVWIAVPRSGPVDSPFTRQISAMREICMKLRSYDYDHPNLKAEDMANRSVADYVAIGVLTAKDAAYIREHEITFHGFDPNKIGGNIPVLEAIFRKTRRPQRIIAYSDASVRFFPLDGEP
jgi:hypothetical protein